MSSTKQTLPKGWRLEKLGNVCEFLDSKRIPINNHERNKRISGKSRDELFPYYGANGQVGWIDDYIFDEPLILLAEDGGNFGSPDKPIAYSVSGKYWVNNHAHVLKPRKELIDFQFCLHSLRIRPDIGDLVSGSTRPKLNQEIASSIQIPLPSLDEQKRIAARLDEQMSHIEQARQAVEEQLSLLNNLVNSYFRQSLKTKTTKMHLSECMVEVKKGVGETWAQYPVLGATRAGVAPAKEKVGKQPQRYKLVEPGTIFYNPMRILLGSIAMLDDGDESGITSPDYVVLKGKEGILHPRWFYYWFRSPYGENFIKSLARGAVRERMLFNRLDKGEIKLPDWDTQVKIAEKLKEIKTFKQALESQLAEINELPSALLRQAFAGEISA